MKKKRINKIEELDLVISVDGIKRKAKMKNVELQYDDNGLITNCKWETFTFTVKDDPDCLVFDDEVKRNNYNIFRAIRHYIRNNG